MAHRLTALAAVLTLLGCVTTAQPSGEVNAQGWTRAEQLAWYHGNQGSRLVPYAWFIALEDAGSSAPFYTRDRMESYGYLAADPDDTYGLPIGFAIDTSNSRNFARTGLKWTAKQKSNAPWVGMNCAACHTNDIQLGNQTVRIDGGATLADFQSFIEGLDAAASATLAQPDKFTRFADKVLGARAAKDGAMLHKALSDFVAWEGKVRALNHPDPARANRYGYGRLDAVGHILNKVALLNGAEDQYSNPADAPVSYPFLWNIGQLDKVQWNGFAPNKYINLLNGESINLGGMGRNAGEVIGVFGDVNITKAYPGLGGYENSIDVKNLDAMEVLVGRLMAPAWPDSFPAIDRTLANKGAALYQRDCAECHSLIDRTDLKTKVTTTLTPIWAGPKPVGTDPWMACNTLTLQAKSGNLQGVPTSYLGSHDKTFGEVENSQQMLVATVAGSLAGKKWPLAETFARAGFGQPRKIKVTPLPQNNTTEMFVIPGGQATPEQRLQFCKNNPDEKLLVYKGRPLNGVWATAPYLHNGSVRTLMELLLPPEQRAKSFGVGSRQFDPVGVGFVDSVGTRQSQFRVQDTAGRPIPGNSNAGHDYNNKDLSDADRVALVEYLKTL